METYIDLILSSEGEKASIISEELLKLGLKPSMGDHDFIYDWKVIVDKSEIVALADKIQSKLKGTRVLIKLTTIR